SGGSCLPAVHLLLFLLCNRARPDLPSSPTRRSSDLGVGQAGGRRRPGPRRGLPALVLVQQLDQARVAQGEELVTRTALATRAWRSEEHTSELQSREKLVCRLLLEKKKNIQTTTKKYS